MAGDQVGLVRAAPIQAAIEGKAALLGFSTLDVRTNNGTLRGMPRQPIPVRFFLAWPIGMPVVRKFDAGLWEVRSSIPAGIARIIFTVRFGSIVLLHGFVKKAQKTPKPDLSLAKRRLNQLRSQ